MSTTSIRRNVGRIAVWVLFGLCAAALLSTGASGCDPNAGDTTGDGDTRGNTTGLPGNLNNPEETAERVARDIENEFPEDDADIVDGLPAEEGPEGSLFGVLLDNGNRIFVIGDVDENNEPVITGAVMEDVSGNLIMKQEKKRETTYVTVATGDMIDFRRGVSVDGLYVSYTLAGTDPPTELVYYVADDDQSVRLIEVTSEIGETPADSYTGDQIKLARSSKAVSMMRSTEFDPAVLREAVASEDCPVIEFVNNGLDDACTVWSQLTANTNANPALAKICANGNVVLDTLRDGDPFDTFDIPGLSTEPVAPEAVAKLKIGWNTLCLFGDAITTGAGWFKNPTKAVDFSCFTHTIINERSRLIRGGGTVADRICRGLRGDILVPGCINTCDTSYDGECDDGGPDSDTDFCQVGTDCADCGPRGEDDYENEPGCTNTCTTNFDGVCDDGPDGVCERGTDCADCGARDGDILCEDSCEFNYDNLCDDGGPGSVSSFCELGTDCTDCGERGGNDDVNPDCIEDDLCNEECSIEDRDPDCDGDDFCRIHDICCDDDGICDLVRCPERTDDNDCDNFHWCDRLDLCCPDDDRCDSDCPSEDEDCQYCDAGNVCIEDCSPVDPDCDETNCPEDGNCELDCEGNDPDCDSCGQDGECVTGCNPEDPDCAEPGPQECFDDAGLCCSGNNFCDIVFCPDGVEDPDCNLCGLADGVCIDACRGIPQRDAYGDPDCKDSICDLAGFCCDDDDRCDEWNPDCYYDNDCDKCPTSANDYDGTCVDFCGFVVGINDYDCGLQEECENNGTCCPNDGVCDVLCNDVFYPGAIDPDCDSNATVCSATGECCELPPGQDNAFCGGVVCPEPEPGCYDDTGSNLCANENRCCPDDGLCDLNCLFDEDCNDCTLVGDPLDGVCVQGCDPVDADCMNEVVCDDDDELDAFDGCCFEGDSCLGTYNCPGGVPPRCPQTNEEACNQGFACCPGEPCRPEECPEGCPGVPG